LWEYVFMEQMATTTNTEEGQMPATVTHYSITILRGREVIDREQLPFNAFSGVEAHAFARRMAEAHGAGARPCVVREITEAAV
jgi:hypothetical protein